MPVERLSPKVGSIPAFYSVQQNINSLLKYFGGGSEKWGMKDEKNNDKRGVWGASPPQKPEHFDATKGNGNHICDPPLWIHK